MEPNSTKGQQFYSKFTPGSKFPWTLPSCWHSKLKGVNNGRLMNGAPDNYLCKAMKQETILALLAGLLDGCPGFDSWSWLGGEKDQSGKQWWIKGSDVIQQSWQASSESSLSIASKVGLSVLMEMELFAFFALWIIMKLSSAVNRDQYFGFLYSLEKAVIIIMKQFSCH